MLIDIFVSL
jgi:hypothetical protein